MEARGSLVAAAKQLIWERGAAATSPHALLEQAGVGQGSLYHHFHRKQDWVLAAIKSLASDLDAETADVFDPARPGLHQLQAYLDKPRVARNGCRLGRLAFDPQVAADPVLAAPIAAYFTATRERLAAAVRDAVSAGDLRADIDADDLADALLAVVQGGYVLARAVGDEAAMTAATTSFRALLESAGHGGEGIPR